MNNYDMSDVYQAISSSIEFCDSREEYESVGNCVIEMLASLGFGDDAIIDALQVASGQSKEADDFIDEMIARIKG
jgi:hypothetical protein